MSISWLRNKSILEFRATQLFFLLKGLTLAIDSSISNEAGYCPKYRVCPAQHSKLLSNFCIHLVKK